MSVPSIPAVSRAYRATSPWRPGAAILGGILIAGLAVAASVLAGAITLALVGGTAALRPSQIRAAFDNPAHAAVWGTALAQQAGAILGVAWLAGWFRGRRRSVLALDADVPSVRTVLVGLAWMAVLLIPYSLLIYHFQRDAMMRDLGNFTGMIQSQMWPAYALMIVVGAPLSEELLFRGFLQSSLSQSRLGFAGAALVTTTAWTALHLQYSIYGLIEVFMIGLFLSWMLWRTGSLWTPILLHGIYNGLQFMAMRLKLLPWM